MRLRGLFFVLSCQSFANHFAGAGVWTGVSAGFGAWCLGLELELVPEPDLVLGLGLRFGACAKTMERNVCPISGCRKGIVCHP